MNKPVMPLPRSKRTLEARLRIGVTLFLRDEKQTIWENGIFQNCFFLLQTLRKSPVVDWCCVIVSGPGDQAKASAFLKSAEAPVITMAEAMNTLDVVIELSAQLDADWGQAFATRGGRIVAMRVANDHIIDAERIAFKLPPGLLMTSTPITKFGPCQRFKALALVITRRDVARPCGSCSISGRQHSSSRLPQRAAAITIFAISRGGLNGVWVYLSPICVR